MNLQQLEMFQAVAATHSFSKAALQLHISQPAVSMQIQALEDYLGVKLFARSSKKVELTEEGRTFALYCERVLALIAELERQLARERGEIRGQLWVGASLTIGEYIMPPLLGRFKLRHPRVKVGMEISNTRKIVQGILTNAYDLGLVEGPVHHPQLEIMPFRRDELILVAAKDFDLPQSLNVKDLQDLPFIFREKGSGTRITVEDRLAAAGLDPQKLQVVMELGSSQAVKGAVETGLGVTIISRLAVEKELLLGTIKEIPVKDLSVWRELSVVRKKKHIADQVINAFIEFLQL